MFFSLEPKIKSEDLYNREQELTKLEKALKVERIILLTGIRRIGKTSLLKVFLECKREQDTFSIFVDCRSFVRKGDIFDTHEFESYILTEIRRIFKENAFKKIFGSISSIKLPWLEFGIKGKENAEISLSMVLGDLNDLLKKHNKKLIFAIDEAQNLRLDGKGGMEILNLLAHAYDHLLNIQFILTGSEVGVLHDFLKTDDPKAPLFGRYLGEIKLERFTKEESVNFLVEGFKQIGIKPNKDEIEGAVNVLDGLVGYLVLYGHTVRQKRNFKEALEETLKIAEQLIAQELDELFAKSENYRLVLKAVAYKWKFFRK